MLNPDEGFTTCHCRSRIIVDYAEKKTYCSICFLPHTPQRPQYLDPTFLNSPDPIIKAFCDRLLLRQTTEINANVNFKGVKDHPRIEQIGIDSIHAACIYVACREDNCTESISEICSAVNKVKPGNMLKAIGFLAEELKFDMTRLLNFKTSDYIDWFCSALEMNSQEVQYAQQVAKYAACVNSPRSAHAIAAMIVYVFCQLPVKKKRLQEVVEVTGVDESVIRQTYEDLNNNDSTKVFGDSSGQRIPWSWFN